MRCREVEVDQCWGLVGGEHRAHHAPVQIFEERVARDAAFFGEHGDLGRGARTISLNGSILFFGVGGRNGAETDKDEDETEAAKDEEEKDAGPVGG